MIEIILAVLGVVVTVLAALIPLRRFRSHRQSSAADGLAADVIDAYYRALAEECRHLPLGTIAADYVRPIEEERVPLPNVYVELDLLPLTRDDISKPVFRKALGTEVLAGIEGESDPESVGAAISGKQSLHVILGDAGSGKTTLINYLTFLLARRSPSEVDIEGLRGLWPVRLLLREVAASLDIPKTKKGTAQILWEALKTDIELHCGSKAAEIAFPTLQSRILREGTLVLLDGLDEVPEDGRLRKVLIQAIQDLVSVLEGTRSRFIVTARPYAYTNPEWHLSGFRAHALQPLTIPQISEFVRLWYESIRPTFGWGRSTTEGKRRSLLRAIDEKEYLLDLGSRPLLLTLMAAVHSNWGKLPEDRADLYEETVILLLGRWQRAREVHSESGTSAEEASIIQALQVGEKRLRASLEQLAFRAHSAQQTSERGSWPAEISRGEVLEAFESVLGEISPPNLIAYLRDRSGLLIERQTGVFSFPHRSFQEFLAASYLAEEPSYPDLLLSLVESDPGWWREVFLLSVGKARRGSMAHAVAVVSLLTTDLSGTDESLSPAPILLAAQALIDLRLIEYAPRHGRYLRELERTKQRLLALMTSEKVEVRYRHQAGLLLSKLGDERAGVGIRLTGTPGIKIPDISWVEVPAGRFQMGSKVGEKNAAEWEAPSHSVYLEGFEISRFPVTNSQFSLFVEAEGYDRKELWLDAGWLWLKDGQVDLAPIQNRKLRHRYRAWLHERARPIMAPRWWRTRLAGPENAPIVGINWYEAMAYAMWLQSLYSQYRGSLRESGEALSSGYRINLPTEAQWEKAARGPNGRIWPWGNDNVSGRANTREEEIGELSSVGIFPQGASPYGVEEMCGNVWEWTRTRWGHRTHESPDFRYPYSPEDGRETLEGTDLRCVRGSAWYGDREIFGRCPYRGWGLSFNVSKFSGFRLVREPAEKGEKRGR